MTSIQHRLPATLRTTRLVLATPALGHVPAMALLANNKRLYEVLARLPHPYCEDDGRYFVEHIARGEEEFAWAIECDGQFIGTIGLHLLPNELPGLGYWLGEAHWGRGYATEAARAVVDAARAAGATALRSRALVTNTASRNVLRKLGFTETGEGLDTTGTNAGRPTAFMRLEFER